MPKAIPEHEFADSFWSKVDRSAGCNGCWPWTGATNGRYGTHKRARSRQNQYAHRTAFELANRCVLWGGVVRHSCDNPVCCNPAHLLFGDQKDNVQDAIARGRHVPPPRHVGASHPGARLTEQTVIEIRQLYAKGKTIAGIARLYGAGETTVGNIVANRTWKHL